MGFLERALAAEEELERERERAHELEARLRGLLRSDESLDLSTARQTEALLVELSNWLLENGSVLDLLPPGFRARLDAQMHALAIARSERGQPQSAFVSTGRKPPPSVRLHDGAFGSGDFGTARPDEGTPKAQALAMIQDEASGFTQDFQREMDMRIRHSLDRGATPHVHLFSSLP